MPYLCKKGADETPLYQLAQAFAHDFEDVFPDDQPLQLPLIRGISTKLTYYQGSPFLVDHPMYNLIEIKELQCKIQELIDRGNIRECLHVLSWLYLSQRRMEP